MCQKHQVNFVLMVFPGESLKSFFQEADAEGFCVFLTLTSPHCCFSEKGSRQQRKANVLTLIAVLSDRWRWAFNKFIVLNYNFYCPLIENVDLLQHASPKMQSNLG